ncbi:MAG: hypothetical protein F4X20_05580 [Dehalococcoidia bacterium]|nr:hypothetical protein [Dehalococcoidia bacterium]
MAVSLSTLAPAIPAHALTGAAGWADEIISFGFIIAIIGILVVMSRLGRRKRLREEERNRQDATD